MNFGDDQEDFDKMMEMFEQATEEEKVRLYTLIGCNRPDGQVTAFNSRALFAEHMATRYEEDFDRIVEGLKSEFGLEIVAAP